MVRSGTTSEETVLVGDTPADIEGGRAHGVRVLAVATGRTPAHQLHDAGADIVIADLTDTDRLVRLVTEDLR
ncbi:HAD family hydrolase [Streptomyces albus]|uniref:HAD family hydrolase n=1 Tax=Streptomyces albus TaxID=1888 RepID=UPI0037009E7F